MFWTSKLHARVSGCTTKFVAAFLISGAIFVPCAAQDVSVQGNNYGNACTGHAVCLIGTLGPYLQFVRDIPPPEGKKGQPGRVGVVVRIVSPFPPNNMVVAVAKDSNLVMGTDPQNSQNPFTCTPLCVMGNLGNFGFGENAQAITEAIG